MYSSAPSLFPFTRPFYPFSIIKLIPVFLPYTLLKKFTHESISNDDRGAAAGSFRRLYQCQ